MSKKFRTIACFKTRGRAVAALSAAALREAKRGSASKIASLLPNAPATRIALDLKDGSNEAASATVSSVLRTRVALSKSEPRSLALVSALSNGTVPRLPSALIFRCRKKPHVPVSAKQRPSVRGALLVGSSVERKGELALTAAFLKPKNFGR